MIEDGGVNFVEAGALGLRGLWASAYWRRQEGGRNLRPDSAYSAVAVAVVIVPLGGSPVGRRLGSPQ